MIIKTKLTLSVSFFIYYRLYKTYQLHKIF